MKPLYTRSAKLGLLLFCFLTLPGIVLAQATFTSARHETLSQQDIDVLFSQGVSVTGNQFEKTKGWTVKINNTVVPVISVSMPNNTTVRVRFDGTSEIRGFKPYLLPGEVLTVSYDGIGTLISEGGVTVFTDKISENNLVFGCAEVIFQTIGNHSAADECSPVVMNFQQHIYRLSLRMRNSSNFTTTLDNQGRTVNTSFLYNVTWGDGSNSNVLPYLSDGEGTPNATLTNDTGFGGAPGVSFTARPVHTYAETVAPNCELHATITPFYNGVATCPAITMMVTYVSFSNNNVNTGEDNFPATVAGGESITAGTNVNAQFTDQTIANCTGLALMYPLHRYVRFRYGITDAEPSGNIPDISITSPAAFGVVKQQITANDAGGTLTAANWYPTGAGGMGLPDANGVILLPSQTTPTLAAYTGVITSDHALLQTNGQRFYVAMDFWDMCNPYNEASPNLPAPFTLENYLEVSGTPVVAGIEASTELTAYPNPTTGFFTLNTKPDRLEIFDLTGKRVPFHQEPNGTGVTVRLTHPVPGVNTVKIFKNGNVVVSKVIVQP